MERSTMLLRTVKHLFRLGPSIPWHTMAMLNNQRVMILYEFEFVIKHHQQVRIADQLNSKNIQTR